MLCQTGCASWFGPRPPDVTSPAGGIPTSCPADSATDAPCRLPWQVRWMIPLDTQVAVLVSHEHGLIQIVTPAACPFDMTTKAYGDGWGLCANNPQWRYDGHTMWLVNGDDVIGVEASTGAVTEHVTDANRANEVRAMDDTPPQPPLLTLHFPPTSALGLADGSGNTQRDDVVDGVWVSFRVGCRAGSVTDIKDAPISHGAPAWGQVCNSPVLYAINEQ